MAEKSNNFETFERKGDKISALFSTQTPPGTIDHLTIGLVANKCKKLRKTSEYLIRLHKNPTVLESPDMPHLFPWSALISKM